MHRKAALPQSPRLLAIDTSTERMAIGVFDGERATCIDAAGGAEASMRLLPEALALVQRAGLAMAQLDAIAFGRGPGAFTGLRTACSVAQGLALGLQRPVLPVDSLMIVADDARAQLDPESTGSDIDTGNDAGNHAPFEVAVLMDARMNEVYAGRYRRASGRWLTVAAPRLAGLQNLEEIWGSAAPAAVAGSALRAFDLRHYLSPATIVIAAERDRAAALLRLALLLWADGGAVDAADGLPLYLRDNVAQTTSERERAKAEPALPDAGR